VILEAVIVMGLVAVYVLNVAKWQVVLPEIVSVSQNGQVIFGKVTVTVVKL